MKDEDILAEFPTDVDDEYINNEGISGTPSDNASISSALALFKCSRILANVLDSVYPVVLSQEQSFRRLRELEDELDSWKSDLPAHLRLEFANGVPAVTVVNSRSPLLVCASKSLTNKVNVLTRVSLLDSCIPLYSCSHSQASCPLR